MSGGFLVLAAHRPSVFPCTALSSIVSYRVSQEYCDNRFWTRVRHIGWVDDETPDANPEVGTSTRLQYMFLPNRRVRSEIKIRHVQIRRRKMRTQCTFGATLIWMSRLTYYWPEWRTLDPITQDNFLGYTDVGGCSDGGKANQYRGP